VIVPAERGGLTLEELDEEAFDCVGRVGEGPVAAGWQHVDLGRRENVALALGVGGGQVGIVFAQITRVGRSRPANAAASRCPIAPGSGVAR
jgi:hypothetical protein